MAQDQPSALDARAERHRLLADPTRLTIVEALQEGPREIAELARLAGVHRNTVRAHLQRLDEAGLLLTEQVRRNGRGRPANRYALREPLSLRGDEYRLLIEGLANLVQRDGDGEISAAARAEGAKLGGQLGRRLSYPSAEQTIREVVEILRRLCFAPEVRRQGEDRFEIQLRSCPFWGGLAEEHGEVICSFHLGLVAGVAEVAAGRPVDVSLTPFVRSDLCHIEVETG